MTQHPAPYDARYGTASMDDGGARPLAIGALVLAALYTAGTVLSEIPFGIAALDYAAGREPSTATGLAGLLLGGGAAFLLIPLWIVTSLWLRAERRRRPDHRFEHGTAGTFFSWIVPLANLVWPYRVVREVHQAALETSRQTSLGAWWTWWLLALVLGQISSRVFERQGYGDAAGPVIGLSVAGSVCLVVAFGYWYRIVQTTSLARLF